MGREEEGSSSNRPELAAFLLDILAAAIEILRKIIASGTATFSVILKTHQGELADQGTDFIAGKSICKHQSIRR